MPITNDTNDTKDVFDFPLAAKITHSKDTETGWKYSCDQIISIHYYQYNKFLL